jgi:hypothetical protein
MKNIDTDKQTTSHTDSQPGYIDKGISFVFTHFAPGDDEVIFEHGASAITEKEKRHGKAKKKSKTVSFSLP